LQNCLSLHLPTISSDESDFLTHLETERANTPATRNVRLAAIRAFMRFIEYREPSAIEQIQRIRSIPMKRVDTRLIDHLNRDEMQALLDAPAPNTRDGIRDRHAVPHLLSGITRL